METIDVPSRHVDPATAIFANGGHVDRLRASVLLPDGYDEGGRYPVLHLLHPTGGDYKQWLEPEGGNVAELAAGLPAIVVMPEAGLGFLSNWWNGGRRADPAWERHYFEELIPLLEERYRIRPGRRWHAIAGYSMGGMGAVFLASQRPDYFGTAASLSGFVSIQRPVSPGDVGAGCRRRLPAALGAVHGLLRHRSQPGRPDRQPARLATDRDGG